MIGLRDLKWLRYPWIVLFLGTLVGCGTGLEWVPRHEITAEYLLHHPLFSLYRKDDCLWGFTADGWVGRILTPEYPCQLSASLSHKNPFLHSHSRCEPVRYIGWQDNRWIQPRAVDFVGDHIWLLTSEGRYRISRLSGVLETALPSPELIYQAPSGQVWLYEKQMGAVCRLRGDPCLHVPFNMPVHQFVVSPPYACFMNYTYRDIQGSTVRVHCLETTMDVCRDPDWKFDHMWNLKQRWVFQDESRFSVLTSLAIENERLWIWQDRWIRVVDLTEQKVRWTLMLESRPSVPPVSARGRAIIATVGRLVYGFNIRNGYRQWETKIPSPAVEMFAIGLGKTAAILVRTLNGEGIILRLDTGEKIYSTEKGMIRDVLVDPPYVLWLTSRPSIQIGRLGVIQRPRRRTTPRFGGFGRRPGIRR